MSPAEAFIAISVRATRDRSVPDALPLQFEAPGIWPRQRSSPGVCVSVGRLNAQ
jgi:hypothetical protein